MNFNATATLRWPLARMGEDQTDPILDQFADYGPAINAGATGQAEVVITFPADSLQQAVSTAAALFGPLRPVGLEVIPTALWDKRADAVPVPALLSVSEVADQMGVSRQAVLQRIESGSLPATRVGATWVVPAGSVPAP